MRLVSIAFSLLMAITPSLLFAQNQQIDDQQTNGVLLPELLRADPNASIFYSALVATHLIDTLGQYLDPNYPEIEYEWTVQALRDNYAGIHRYLTSVEDYRIAYPDKREFKYTLFIVKDADLAALAIYNLDDLREYAKQIYPEGADLSETERESSLNKLISYHILPFWLPYDQLNISQPEIIRNRKALDELDVEDFYETLLPHSIMRISTPYQDDGTPLGIYINRKGTNKSGSVIRGIEISKKYSSCINGGYYYVDTPLLYDTHTRQLVLDTRMRIMASTLSPDFINSGARGRLSGDPVNGGNANLNRMVFAFKPGFCKNVEWIDGQTQFFVRYRDRYFGTYYGDELSIVGAFDIVFRLPSVPADGLYELRIWNNSMSSFYTNYRGSILFYTRDEDSDFIPFGTPVDCSLSLRDSLIGGVPDKEYDHLSDSQREAAINANDKLLHDRGYLKAPDSYAPNNNLRDDIDSYRKIISELYMESDKYYYLRIRQVSLEGVWLPFNFIEIVPYSVYSGENGQEDKH